MMMRNTLLGAALFGAALLLPGSAALANCESITNAFAYNECLAKQGPQRSVSRGRRSNATPLSQAQGRARYNPAVDDGGPARGVRISRNRGRSSAVIDPWASIKNSFTPARGKRRR